MATKVIRAAAHGVQTFASRAKQMFVRSRAGSVLIMVVALLVLVALIATAMISTARIDRYSSAQNTTNTQVDLLLDGAENLAKGAIIGDLFGSSVGGIDYRPPSDTGVSSTYIHGDALQSVQSDGWLADRVPTLRDPVAAISATNPRSWRTVSYPLLATGTGGIYQFDVPISAVAVATPAASKLTYRFE
ncbi:MAG: hypothetical protein ACREIT_04440, partial [Tepidisphaeraceae bacterium]